MSDFYEVRKNPEVYIKICDKLNVNPMEVAHVGDHYKFDYIVPKSIGIDAYLIDRFNKHNGGLRDLREFSSIFTSKSKLKL